MDYLESKRAIASIADNSTGIHITRQELYKRLSGAAARSYSGRNVMNGDVIRDMLIGPFVVELAIADFTGFRGIGKYMVGVSVWSGAESYYELSELIDIEALADKLEALAYVGAKLEGK